MAVCCHPVACGFLNLLNEAVSAEDAEQSADPGSKLSLIEWWKSAGFGVELVADIAIAKARDGELATGDGFEQGSVVGIAKAQSTNPAVIEGDSSTDRIENL